jgi:two-component system sensor histidine kinase KdpD
VAPAILLSQGRIFLLADKAYSQLVSDDRPDPDALLAEARQEGRGRLKVFLGAAPGVGKTYEMLSEGAAKQRTGMDVVIGVVETHGRAETQALIAGHEIVPRRMIDYQGRAMEEMDLDAILARRPQLVLVDELAHTNAPCSRHPKRYQDIDELLAAGIDVYSTVNVQHVESLNDVVASFTRVRVRETVPDRVLDEAEIEVVDIPPDELIDRLKDGKVYVPEEATRALSHFFSKSNLSALRELALRRAAQAVDTQMLDYVRSHALEGNWAAGERILVAVSELPGADHLVRETKRIADAQRAPWTALSIETPRTRALPPEYKQRIAATMHLASQLGATVMAMPAASVIEGLKAYVQEGRITQIVVGKSQRSKLFELRHGSVVDRLVRETPGVAVHVLPMEGTPQGAPRPAAPRAGAWGPRSDYAWAALMIAAVTAFAVGLSEFLDVANVALLYMLPVMAAASLYGLRAGLLTGIGSSLAYNFFFLPPTGTLTISNPENVVTILVLLAVAFVTSQFAARVRAQADLAAASAKANGALAGFLRQITRTANEEDLGQTICAEISQLFGARAALIVASPNGPRIAAASWPDPKLDTIELAAAQWVLDRGQTAGRGSETLTAADSLFVPIRTAEHTLATLGLDREDGAEPITSDQLPLLTGLLDQAALGLARARAETETRDVAQLKERDRLRAALLSSVSHDLRTPLTSILAAAAELRTGTTEALIDTIQAEAERLNRFVANLLDMARVEAGALALKKEAIDLTDAVASAVHDTRRVLEGHKVVLEVAPDLPLVRADPQLLHHCLINLLDNAGRYADPGTAVTIRAARKPDGLVLSILDHGPGLPPGRETEVFETFRRLEGSDQAQGGTGLGLAIVKGFAEAMGLGVQAANRSDAQGARFSLRFPETALVASRTP